MFQINNNNFPLLSFGPQNNANLQPNCDNSNQESYISSKKLQFVSEAQFNNYLLSFNTNDLLNLRTAISNSSLILNENSKPNIGFFNSLAHLLEKAYNFNQTLKTYMMGKYSMLSDDIYKYRPIKGDGNCFYRAVIFSFIEQIILLKDLQLLKNVIFDIQTCFNDPYLNKYNIQVNLIIKVLILIHVALKKGKVQQGYELYVKSWNNNNQFDNGLILYFRYILYRFIKENENKLYMKEFAVKLGNLLPIEYETKEGNFLFWKFYDEYLMKMGKDAEKIVIYLTPYVLCLKLEIVMFDCENDFRKSLNFVGEANFTQNVNIALLNKKDHYELIYTKEYYRMNIDFFKDYTTTNIRNIVLTEIKEEDEPNTNLFLSIEKQNLLNFDEMNQKLDKVSLIDLKNTTNMNTNMFNYNPGLNQNNGIKCPRCKINNPMTRNNISVCHICFFQMLKEQICAIYLKNIKSVQQIFKSNTDSSSFNRIFFQFFQNEKIKINSSFFSIDHSIQAINVYLSPANRIILVNLSNEFKAQCCLQCQKKLQNCIRIPCGCSFCSIECVANHYTTVNVLDLKKVTKDFECICTTNYEAYQILSLVFLFERLKLQQLKDKAKKLYKKITQDCCSKCQSKLPKLRNSYVFVKCSNEIMDPLFNIPGKQIFFLHPLCLSCFNDGNNKKFFCIFCRGEHNILSKEQSDNDESIIGI